MSVVPIRRSPSAAPSKVVEANQTAISGLPYDSGTWRVEGIPGLYLRCRKQSKTFFIQRRVRGVLVKETLKGVETMKQAKAAAMGKWKDMKPLPTGAGVVTFGAAFEDFLANKRDRRGKPLAERTKALARYNLNRYLPTWKGRALHAIGEDRAAVRTLQNEVTARYGMATANQVTRLVSAVYRYQRAIDPSLPEPPTTVVRPYVIEPRDWALSDDELRAWWAHETKPKGSGKPIKRGVSTLSTVKRMWWLTALFTGARKGSIEALRWSDLDMEGKVLKFEVAKGDRGYSIPMADRLAGLLAAYQDSGDVPPSEWVFPSNRIEGDHIGDVKNTAEGVPPAHRLRHTFRTTLARIAAAPDHARMLLGHSLGGDVSRGYISAPLVVESLRPVTNAVAARYIEILGW